MARVMITVGLTFARGTCLNRFTIIVIAGTNVSLIRRVGLREHRNFDDIITRRMHTGCFGNRWANFKNTRCGDEEVV